MGFSLALLVEKSLMVELCYASGWKSNANVTQKGNLKRSLEKDRTATPFWVCGYILAANIETNPAIPPDFSLLIHGISNR